MEGLWCSLTTEAQSKIINLLQTNHFINALIIIRRDKSWVRHNPLFNVHFFYVKQFLQWVKYAKTAA